jgi:hypothetical protein
MTDTPAGPVDVTGSPEELFRASIRLLTSVRETVELRLTLFQAEDPVSGVQDLLKKTGELEQALRSAIELERRFHDWKAKTEPGESADDIDFDRVREDIRCRLARIRDCRGET